MLPLLFPSFQKKKKEKFNAMAFETALSSENLKNLV